MSDYLKKLDEALKQITKYTTITDNRYNKADGTPANYSPISKELRDNLVKAYASPHIKTANYSPIFPSSKTGVKATTTPVKRSTGGSGGSGSSGIFTTPTTPTPPAATATPSVPAVVKPTNQLPTLPTLDGRQDYYSGISYADRPDYYSGITVDRPDYYSGINTQRNYDDYNSKYLPYLEQLYNQMGERKFDYDLNADTLYHQMKDRYIQQGQEAMIDTIGQASAMTGGYGNSYAQTAGQNMYDQYLMALNDQIPALRERAFNEWLAEGDQLQRQFENAGRLENYDYSRYRDMVGDWERDRDTQLSIAGAQTDDYYNWLAQQMNLAGAREDMYRSDRAAELDLAQAKNDDYYKYLNAQLNLTDRDTDNYWKQRNQDYNLAMSLIQNGVMPDDAALANAGIDKGTAQRLAQLVQQKLVDTSGSSGGGSGGGGRSSGGGKKKTTGILTLTDGQINRGPAYIDMYGLEKGLEEYGDSLKAQGVDDEVIANRIYNLKQLYAADEKKTPADMPSSSSNINNFAKAAATAIPIVTTAAKVVPSIVSGFINAFTKKKK